MKNIILIDPRCNLIENIISSKNISIEIAIVDNNWYKNIKIDTHKINEFYLYRGYDKELDFYHNIRQKKLDLTYEEIEKYRHMQLEVEHLFLRSVGNIAYSQNLYYHALSYWINIFKSKKIDYVLSSIIYHGDVEDMVISIAKSFGVQVYLFEEFFIKKSYSLGGLLDWNKKEYLPISDFKSLNRPSLDDIVFSDTNKLYAMKNQYKTPMHKIADKLGGAILTLAVSRILGKYSSIYLGSRVPFREYLSEHFHIKNLLKHYNKISTKDIGDKKYIYYSLHFDPEALTMARSCISSQIALIKILSDSVPDDVYIYVKDHPLFTKLNTKEFSYYLINMRRFRSIEFYDEIAKMRNVRLVNLEASSEELVKNSMAISSISGSVIPENIVNYKKPIIMFDNKISPVGMVEDIFKVRSTKECKDAIEKIYAGFIPEYSDFDKILDTYCFKSDLDSKLISTSDLEKLLD